MRSLATVAFVLSITHTWAQQIAFQRPLVHDVVEVEDGEEPLESFSETIVSTLSSSTQHTTFLKLLQRSKCIPLLAHINSSTVFAPTDQAWTEWADTHRPEHGGMPSFGWLGSAGLDPWTSNHEVEDESEDFDNQNWALRQHLLYHMFNYTLPADAFISNDGPNITTETTLLFPMTEEPERTPLPPPGPPWLPRGGDGLLSGHGQRIRLAKAGSEAGGERGMIGVDWTGKNGVSVWDGSGWKKPGNDTLSLKLKKGRRKGDQGGEHGGADSEVTGMRWTRNGVVVGVDGVLEPPPSIGECTRSSTVLLLIPLRRDYPYPPLAILPL